MEYFMFNRNLTSQETPAAAMNAKYPGFDFPFYNNFERTEIERRIKETTEGLDEIKGVDGADAALVDYCASKVEVWKVKLRLLNLFGEKTLDEISPQANVSVNYQQASKKSDEVLIEVALAFYQMRNYECLRYFNETYLSLFERMKRLKRPIDRDKFEALEILHRASIYDNDRSKREFLYFEEPQAPPMPID